MKIPKHINDSIKKASKAFVEARQNEKIVRDWLDKQGLKDETTNDQWIDCIEMGHGQEQEFKEYIKSV